LHSFFQKEKKEKEKKARVSQSKRLLGMLALEGCVLFYLLGFHLYFFLALAFLVSFVVFFLCVSLPPEFFKTWLALVFDS